MKTKYFRVGQKITFQVGDLVVPNFKMLKIEEYDCLYIVTKVEEPRHTEYLWWETPDKDYIYLHVREVKTGREVNSLVTINKGSKGCDYLIVEE